MAITERQKPASFSTPHGKLFHVIESNNTANANFKFVFDVYVNAVKIATVKQFPVPSTIYSYFDVSDIIKAYLDQLYFTGDQSFKASLTTTGKYKIAYEIKYGEEYGSPVTTYTNLTLSGSVTVYNYINLFTLQSSLTQLSAYDGNLLTDSPKAITLQTTENAFTNLLNTAAASKQLLVKKYNSAGSLLGTYTPTAEVWELFQVNYGVPAINTASPGFIDASVAYYTIGTATDFITVTIESFCLYPSYHLIFMNRLGAYESFWFRGKSKVTSDIERKAFGKNNFGLDGYTMKQTEIGSTNVFRGDGQTVKTTSRTKYKLSSSFLSDAEFVYLYQLISSPVIYLEHYEGATAYYFPVKITANSYDFKTSIVDKIQPLEVEIELLNQFNSQSF